MKNKGVEIADLSSTMLVSTFFFLWLAYAVPERTDAFAKFARNFRNAPGAKKKQNNNEDDEQFWKTWSPSHNFLLL